MIDPNWKAKDRIHKDLPEDLQELMRKYVLSDEEHKKVLQDIKDKSYEGKRKFDNPKFIIVLGQTGAGKSNITSALTTQDEDLVVIDSDKYKAYRRDSAQIQREHLVEYTFLTAVDAYQHRDEMIYDTMKEKYNILMECATSEKEGMFVNIDKIRQHGYDVEIAVLGVSEINSLISVHERYESQIDLNLSSAKLTSIARHDDSFSSLVKCIKQLDENDVGITVYRRGKEFPFIPNKIYATNDEVKTYASAVEALSFAQIQDKKETMNNFNQRFLRVQQQMINRNAPLQQIHQLNQVFDRYKKERDNEKEL